MASRGFTDNPQKAQEHLTSATRMYREMEMPFWLEKAKADSEELAPIRK